MKISPKVFLRQNIQKLMMVNMSMNQLRRRYGNRASTCVVVGVVCSSSTDATVWAMGRVDRCGLARVRWLGWRSVRWARRRDCTDKAGGVIERSMHTVI